MSNPIQGAARVSVELVATAAAEVLDRVADALNAPLINDAARSLDVTFGRAKH